LFFYCSIVYSQKDGWVENIKTKKGTSNSIPEDYYEKALYENGKKIEAEIYEISYNHNGRVMQMTVVFKDSCIKNNKIINYVFGGGYDTIMLQYFFYSDSNNMLFEHWSFYRSNVNEEYYGSVKSYYNYLNDTEQKFEPGEKYITLPHDPDSLFYNIPKVFGYSDSILRLKKIKRK
jgi:hypothetical protein